MASPTSGRKRAPHMRDAERRPEARPRLESPDLYLNPHLSLLAFQRRVLEEALEPSTPLLERVKFLSILGSNMDEFFMVRVAGLWQQIETRTTEISMDGRSPSEQLELIRQEVTSIMTELYRLWREELMPNLRAQGIYILGVDELNPQQRVAVDEYFKRVVYPVLTPLAVDQGRPFPHISNLSLNVAAVVSNGDGIERFARIKVPDSLPQLVALPSSASELTFIWLEHAITCNLRLLFPEMEILSSVYVPPDAGCGARNSGARDRRPARERAGSGLETAVSRCGSAAGGYGDAAAANRYPDRESRAGSE